MIIGYGRTSTIEQVAGLEAQIRDLKAAGAEKLFRENVSSVAPRQQLKLQSSLRAKAIPWLSRKLTAWRARSGICAKSLIGCRRGASPFAS
jgi:DNA invertase Pin-like site-specific DNA recombinase